MDSIFLKACQGEATDRAPVWLMRQAGRYMKDYRAIREKTPFLELCKNEDLVVEVTVTAQEKLGVDAAIIFSDILLVVEAMGLNLAYLKNEGPSITKAIESKKDIENLKNVDPVESLGYVLRAIKKTRAALKKDIPLIGFAGAPFTVASYMIEGGPSKDFKKTKDFMRTQEPAWRALMEKLSTITAHYLLAQAQAGAQAVQLFDSWVGCLNKEEYDKYAKPYTASIFKALEGRVIRIHFGTKTAPFLESFSQVDADVIGVDHRISLKEAWPRIGYKKAIQGNLDPAILLGSVSDIQKEVKRILSEAGDRPGYIFNLGHGVLQETPEENVLALVQMVKEA